MAALSGGETCVKHLMFAFNLLFWVSLRREGAFSCTLLGWMNRALRGSTRALRVVRESRETLCVRALLQQVREELREIRPRTQNRPESAQTASLVASIFWDGHRVNT